MGDEMKYLLMIYNNPAMLAAMPAGDMDQVVADVHLILKELTDSGELISTEALADVSQSRTVRVRNGVPATTDGPFVEAKEHLAGYLVLDCETPERAIDIAARWPDARYCAMEVRPIMDTSGTEM